MTRGERVIAFIEKYCITPDGAHVGKPIILDEFQKSFILDVYDNPHVTNNAILSMARKNGKTALIAAITLAHLVGPEARRNSQIVSGARSRKQAAQVYNYASKMAALSPKLRQIVRTVPSSKMLIGIPLNVEYYALSAESTTAMGESPILAILDEVGQVVGPSDAFIDAITTAQGAHESPLLISISTQAANDSDLFSIWIDDALTGKDKRTVVHLYTATPAADLDDEHAWAMANPAMGVFRSKEDIASMAAKAKRMPSFANTFRNLILNQRVSSHSPFVSKDVWTKCGGEIDESVFDDHVCYIGVDLSQRTDLTSAVIIAQDDDGEWHVKPLFWTPENGLHDRVLRDKAPYDVWVDRGFLRTTPGNTVDYSVVARDLAEEMDGRDVGFLAFDRWRFDVMQKALDDLELGWEVKPFGQGFKDMGPAVDNIEALLLDSMLRHGMNPVLTMCAANTVIVKDPAGNRKFDKAKSTGRIDGMVALLMAYGVANAEKTETSPGMVLL